MKPKATSTDWGTTATVRATARPAEAPAADPYADSNAPRWLKFLWRTLSPRHVIVAAALLLLPFVASPFLTFQVAAQATVPFERFVEIDQQLRHGLIFRQSQQLAFCKKIGARITDVSKQ